MLQPSPTCPAEGVFAPQHPLGRVLSAQALISKTPIGSHACSRFHDTLKIPGRFRGCCTQGVPTANTPWQAQPLAPAPSAVQTQAVYELCEHNKAKAAVATASFYVIFFSSPLLL